MDHPIDATGADGADLLGEIVGVVQDVSCTQVADERAVLARFGSPDHRRPPGCRQLHGKGADAAGGAADEDRLPSGRGHGLNGDPGGRAP